MIALVLVALATVLEHLALVFISVTEYAHLITASVMVRASMLGWDILALVSANVKVHFWIVSEIALLINEVLDFIYVVTAVHLTLVLEMPS